MEDVAMPDHIDMYTIQADFDRLALLSEEGWDHNNHYHNFLENPLLASSTPLRCHRCHFNSCLLSNPHTDLSSALNSTSVLM